MSEKMLDELMDRMCQTVDMMSLSNVTAGTPLDTLIKTTQSAIKTYRESAQYRETPGWEKKYNPEPGWRS